MAISARRILGREAPNQIVSSQTSKRLFAVSGSKPNVLIYTMNYAPEKTGAGRVTGEIGPHLVSNGFEVGVITAPPHYPGWRVAEPYRSWRYAREICDGVKIRRCPIVLSANMHGIRRLIAPLSFALTSAPVALWKVVKDRPKVVLCIEPTLFVAPIALLARFAGAQVLLHVQDLEADAAFAVGHLKGALLKKIILRIESWLLRRFSGVITISGRMREQL